MPSDPIYLQQAMGYALWHLQQGELAQTVREEIATSDRFSFLTAEQIDRAMVQAMVNYRASSQLADYGTSQTIGAPFGLSRQSNEVVGVRVLVTGLDQFGNTIETSVTVDANASQTIGDIRAAALDFALQQSLNGAWAYELQADTLEAKIFQVVSGGLENAALTLEG